MSAEPGWRGDDHHVGLARRRRAQKSGEPTHASTSPRRVVEHDGGGVLHAAVAQRRRRCGAPRPRAPPAARSRATCARGAESRAQPAPVLHASTRVVKCGARNGAARGGTTSGSARARAIVVARGVARAARAASRASGAAPRGRALGDDERVVARRRVRDARRASRPAPRLSSAGRGAEVGRARRADARPSLAERARGSGTARGCACLSRVRARAAAPRAPARPCRASVRARGRSSRASCIVIVDAPDTTRRARSVVRAARASARRSTPGCSQKRRSSTATKAVMRSGSMSVVAAPTRARLPSAARVRAERRAVAVDVEHDARRAIARRAGRPGQRPRDATRARSQAERTPRRRRTTRRAPPGRCVSALRVIAVPQASRPPARSRRTCRRRCAPFTRGVVHLLGVRGRPHERAGRRRAREVRGRVACPARARVAE